MGFVDFTKLLFALSSLAQPFNQVASISSQKTRGVTTPTQTTCSSSQLLIRVIVHQDHVMSVYY